MRSNYPISSKENKNDIDELQETFISLIGYDSNPFDNVIEKEGLVGDLINSVDSSGNMLLTSRLFGGDLSTPIYSNYYQYNLLSLVRRQ